MSGAQHHGLFGVQADASIIPAPARYAGATFSPIRTNDLIDIEAIEREVYEYPWTLGNFQDSLTSGYQCWLARDAIGTLVGYFLLMLAPDEGHLLNITVLPAMQGKGFGRRLLEHAITISKTHGAPAVLLEVRPSNPQALAVYRHMGFKQIGIRKRYYPAANHQREDAIVMRLAL